jgi:hypothetical protein
MTLRHAILLVVGRTLLGVGIAIVSLLIFSGLWLWTEGNSFDFELYILTFFRLSSESVWVIGALGGLGNGILALMGRKSLVKRGGVTKAQGDEAP